jgi:ppGpp synthetase/RelA/SpoT-type nucleotidyltranferase
MSGSKDDLGRFAADYQRVLPYAEFWQQRVTDELTRLIGHEGVVLAFPVESRIKKWSSIRDKLARLTPKTIEGVQDILGFRVVTLFKRDVFTVSNVVKRAPWFRVIRTYDTGDRLEVDRFGYSGVHFVIELPFAEDQPTFGVPLHAEIQIRSVAQHLWAAASHTLQYKHEADVPPPVRRAVHRVAALLETVDLELERVLDERRQYADAIADRHDEELNVDLLNATLTTVWPPEHQTPNAPYAMLLGSLLQDGIRTPRQLTDALRPYRARTLAIARKEAERLVFLADRYGVNSGKITFSSAPNRHEMISVTDDVLKRARAGVFYSHTGLTWTALGLATGTHTHLEDRESV